MTDSRTMARSTRQRTAVIELLDQVEEFRSAQELHMLLREQGTKVGLTTVYRTLQALADSESIDVMQMPSGEYLYRRCSTGHHHHLVCRECGGTVEVAGMAVERWAETIASEYGFTDVAHTVEIFGRCPQCSGKA